MSNDGSWLRLVMQAPRCCAIYKSGAKAGSSCGHTARWLIAENSALKHVCGLHSKGCNRVPYVYSPGQSSSADLGVHAPRSGESASRSDQSTLGSPAVSDGTDMGVQGMVQFLPKVLIGTGAHSRVYSVKINGCSKAVKLFRRDPGYQKMVHREIYALQILNSPFIIKPEASDTYGLIMPLGAPVSQYISSHLRRNQNPLSSSGTSKSVVSIDGSSLLFFLRVCRDVACALQYLHSLRMVHMDVKPDNIVMFPNEGSLPLPPNEGSLQLQAKLIDFGGCLSMLQQDDDKKAITPTYSSPEVLLGRRSCVSPAHDIWSMGVMMYRYLYGFHPYNRYDQKRKNGNSRAHLEEIYRVCDQEINSCSQLEATPSISSLQPSWPSLADYIVQATSIKTEEVLPTMLRWSPTDRISVHSLLEQLNRWIATQ